MQKKTAFFLAMFAFSANQKVPKLTFTSQTMSLDFKPDVHLPLTFSADQVIAKQGAISFDTNDNRRFEIAWDDVVLLQMWSGHGDNKIQTLVTMIRNDKSFADALLAYVLFRDVQTTFKQTQNEKHSQATTTKDTNKTMEK